jgi:hypothetical protein
LLGNVSDREPFRFGQSAFKYLHCVVTKASCRKAGRPRMFVQAGAWAAVRNGGRGYTISAPSVRFGRG